MLAINTTYSSETQYHSSLFNLPSLPELNTITEEETWELLVEDLTDLTLVTSSPTSRDASSFNAFVKALPSSTLPPPRSNIKSSITAAASSLSSKVKTKKFSSKLHLSPYYRPSKAITNQKHFIN